MSSVPARSRQGRQVNAIQALSLLVAFLLVAGLGGVLSAGLVMPVVAATGTVTDTSVRLFDELPSELEQVVLPEKSRILAADGTLLATFFQQNRIVVGSDQISQNMKNAVIATEDRRFYEHSGVDLPGMGRALMRNLTQGQTEGASTLTQQYVKNALIQAALTAETEEERAAAIEAAREADGIEGIARKLREAKTAITLEERMTKDEILVAYLNIAQFGLSVYGVEAASQYFFSIPASELNYLQAATIAGVTQAPSKWDPERDPAASQTRRNEVLSDMLREKYITQEEYDAGIAAPIESTLAIGQVRLGCMEANAVANAGYFCDYVTKIIAQDPELGGSLLYRGGLTVTTTLDVAKQQIADTEVKNSIPVLDPSGVATAMSVVEPGTGKVLAMAQNRVYNTNQDGLAPGETAVNYNTDNKYGSASGFPPGSTFKPFTLLEWFKQGHSLSETVNGSERKLNENMFTACGSKFPSRPWEPGNAEGGAGYMTVQDATRNSVNHGYLSMATQLDLCNIMNGAAELGIHKAGGLAGEGNFDAIPANVIGSNSVAPLTMAAAFAAFASGGTFCEPIAITSILDRDGNPLPVPAANCRQAITPEIAAAMNHALSRVWSGTAKGVPDVANHPSAGKTGTTSRNEHTWFVGYTAQMAAAVWVGFPDGMRPVQNMTINGQRVRYTYGATFAAPTWSRFMNQASAGMPSVDFAAAASTQIEGVRVSVPNVAGKSEDAARTTLRNAGFNVRTDPTAVYSDAPAGTVAGTDPGSGSSVTRGTLITIRMSQGRDPAAPPTGGGNDGNPGNGDGRGRDD